MNASLAGSQIVAQIQGLASSYSSVFASQWGPLMAPMNNYDMSADGEKPFPGAYFKVLAQRVLWDFFVVARVPPELDPDLVDDDYILNCKPEMIVLSATPDFLDLWSHQWTVELEEKRVELRTSICDAAKELNELLAGLAKFLGMTSETTSWTVQAVEQGALDAVSMGSQDGEQ